MSWQTDLADVCKQIDRTYSVRLEYGAHVGDVPHWQMSVSLPFQALHLVRALQRGNDSEANMEAARSIAYELERYISSYGWHVQGLFERSTVENSTVEDSTKE